jgi:hypothetical protein
MKGNWFSIRQYCFGTRGLGTGGAIVFRTRRADFPTPMPAPRDRSFSRCPLRMIETAVNPGFLGDGLQRLATRVGSHGLSVVHSRPADAPTKAANSFSVSRFSRLQFFNARFTMKRANRTGDPLGGPSGIAACRLPIGDAKPSSPVFGCVALFAAPGLHARTRTERPPCGTPDRRFHLSPAQPRSRIRAAPLSSRPGAAREQIATVRVW